MPAGQISFLASAADADAMISRTKRTGNILELTGRYKVRLEIPRGWSKKAPRLILLTLAKVDLQHMSKMRNMFS